MNSELYDQCKRKVKLWEKNFRKEKGRIPSKHDFQEADREVRDAYRQYGRMKTAHLAKELADVFTDDDSMTQYSQISELTISSPVSQGFFSQTTLDEDSCHDENRAAFNRLNQEAWNFAEAPNKPDAVENVEEVPKPRLRMNKSFTMRNPRKSLSNRRNSLATTTSSSSLYIPTDEIFPDYEAILLEKARREKCQEEVAAKETKKPVEKQPLINLDAGYLERQDPSWGPITNNVSRHSSYGLSNLKMNLSQSSAFTTNAIATYESDDSIVANSEDESTIEQSSQSRRSIRHIIKKQRVDEWISETPAASPVPSPMPPPSPVPDPSPAKRKPAKKATIKRAQPPKEKKPVVERSLRRSTRTRANVTEPPIEQSEEEEEEDLFADASDDDPLYTAEEPQEQPKRVKKPKAPKKPAPAKKSVKAAKKVEEPPPPSPPNEDFEKSQEFTDYVLEYGIERVENVPRVNAAELKKSEILVGKFVIGESTVTTQPAKKPAAVNADRAKLEKKIAAGSLNDNYRTINIQKKVYMRGKKKFNFSKYKKSQWKQKKAAALSGPEMDMGGCDGGLLTCFQCGGLGHMARQCKAKSDNLLPLEADADVSPFPTLDEAQQMVDEKKLLAHARNPASMPNPAEVDSDVEMAEAVLIPAPIRHKVPEEFLQKTGFLERASGKDTVEALYADGIETPQEVYDALKLFGHDSFRPGQEQAVMRILSGKSTLVTLSTGSGKSLCYQLPAYLYRQRRKCITLVISPLVSLMEDQVVGVPKFLNAQCLHTNQTDKQREKIMLMVKEEKIDVLLVSPEAVVAGEKATGFGALLRRLPPIAFVCIDEAHCVSQWSHNFRPSYLSICRVLKEKLNVTTILGLTATATKSTRLSIVDHIGVPDGETGIISDIPMPDNLLLTVSKDRDRDLALIELIKSERFTECNSIIVYCTRREECERVASVIRTTLQSLFVPVESSKRKRCNWIAEPYHAGMPASRRRTIQNAFMSGELRIVVATVAFGMGINKSNIRAVIHYNMPKSFESYVQEIGRAGRDGKQAHCHVFLDARGGDRNELRRHIYSNSIDRHVIRKLLQKIFVPCACGGGSDKERKQPSSNSRKCPGHEVCFSIEETVQLLDIPEENIATLLCYLELHEQRYIQVLSRAYTKCKIFSYGGIKDFRAAARNCPPLAMAIALDLRRSIAHETSNSIEFNVVEVASAIGWDSGVVKYQLKQLEWTTVADRPKRSRITVQFSDLGFRVRAPGDMTDEALDESLELLHRRVSQQEMAELLQLQTVFNSLSGAAFNSYLRAAERECSQEPSEALKKIIREYFAIEQLNVVELEADTGETSDEQLLNDIRVMIQRYPENSFNGRTLARIFHGVSSPNYPAVIWGRCKYWRVHMDADFNRIVRLANAELVRMRL